MNTINTELSWIVHGEYSRAKVAVQQACTSTLRMRAFAQVKMYRQATTTPQPSTMTWPCQPISTLPRSSFATAIQRAGPSKSSPLVLAPLLVMGSFMNGRLLLAPYLHGLYTATSLAHFTVSHAKVFQKALRSYGYLLGCMPDRMRRNAPVLKHLSMLT